MPPKKKIMTDKTIQTDNFNNENFNNENENNKINKLENHGPDEKRPDEKGPDEKGPDEKGPDDNIILELLKQLNNVNNKLELMEKKIESFGKIYNFNLEKIEKGLLSINTDLINQNIKMSDIAFGKLPEPQQLENSSSNNSSNNSCNNNLNSNSVKDNIKNLYYYEQNNAFIVYGPGTYDNKEKLKKHGEWNGINKNWKLTITKELLLEEFKNIIEKEELKK